MTSLVIPNTVVPGQPENVLQVTENWQAVVTKLRGQLESDNFAAAGIQKADLLNRETAYPRPIWQVSSWRTDVEGTAERVFGIGNAPMSVIGVTTAYQTGKLFRLNPADYVVAGATARIRMRGAMHCNAVGGWNAGQTNQLQLRRLTATSGTGGSMFTTLGTAVLTLELGAGSSSRHSGMLTSTWADLGSLTAGLYLLTSQASVAPPGGGVMAQQASIEVSWT